jgi:thiamine biosynthesis protein ThiI
MQLDHVVVHYAEIGTKSGNRSMFEKALARNLREMIAPWADVVVRRETGRITFSLEGVADEDRDAVIAAAARQPGVAYVSPARRTEPTMEAMKEAVVELASRRGGSFKIASRRSEKTLPFRSHDMNVELGAAVQAATERPVDVHTPDDTYVVEVDSRRAYVRDARIEGPGGLPVGVSGKVVSLLSGGIDSPVASYLAMLRGCRVTGVHFWNRSYSGEGVREKVLAIGRALARHQPSFRLVLIPFEDIQQEIIAASPAPLRMLLYRRAMLRVAGVIRRRSNAGGLVLGDNVGQVASQTLPNLAAVYEAAEPPLLTPLIGANKMDIVATAQRIGTYEPSILPGADCCTLLVARHPATGATAEQLREIEEHCDLDPLIRAAIEQREVHTLPPA